MKWIRAILRMISSRLGKGNRATFASQERATYHKLHYLFSKVKPGSKDATCQDRVSWIGGCLAGHGIVTRKADLMATALDCGHQHLPGRRTRHLILSCEPLEGERRVDAERRLIASAPLLAGELGAERWIAVIHCDKQTPHMHMIVANFDPAKGRRLEITPVLLSELQRMEWTSHLDSGKGSRMGPLSERALAIQALKIQDSEATKRALEKVWAHMQKHKKLDLSQDDLALWLASQCLEQGWDRSRLLRQDGSPRKKPVIQVDGIDLRLVFLRRFIRQHTGNQLKKTPRSPANKRRCRRIAHPESPSGPV